MTNGSTKPSWWLENSGALLLAVIAGAAGATLLVRDKVAENYHAFLRKCRFYRRLNSWLNIGHRDNEKLLQMHPINKNGRRREAFNHFVFPKSALEISACRSWR